MSMSSISFFFFFFFNDTATTEIYTFPYTTLFRSRGGRGAALGMDHLGAAGEELRGGALHLDRKSTRLNSSHVSISYAVFCLKKKKNTKYTHQIESTRTYLRYI